MCVGLDGKKSPSNFLVIPLLLLYTGLFFSFLTCWLWMAGRVKEKETLEPASFSFLLLLSSQHSRPPSSWEKKVKYKKLDEEEDNYHCLE